MKKIATFFILVALITTTACARSFSILDEAYKEKDGTVKVYDIDLATAKKIAIEILKEEGFDAIQDEGNIIKTSSMRTFFLVALTQVNSKKTEVRAISKRRFAQELSTTLTENGFFIDFDEKIQKLKK